jgi:hypothetical protein
MNEWNNLFSQTLFPVAVAAFLLISLVKQNTSLARRVTKLEAQYTAELTKLAAASAELTTKATSALEGVAEALRDFTTALHRTHAAKFPAQLPTPPGHEDKP